MTTIHVDVVSAEEAIFSGEAEFVVLRRSGRTRHLSAPHAADHGGSSPGWCGSGRRARARRIRCSSPVASSRCSRTSSPCSPTPPSRQGPRRGKGQRVAAGGRGGAQERDQRSGDRQGRGGDLRPCAQLAAIRSCAALRETCGGSLRAAIRLPVFFRTPALDCAQVKTAPAGSLVPDRPATR